MIDPYRMVFISVFSSIIISFIIFFYFKYFAKNKINYLFILFLLSLLPIINIFRPGSYESGDLSLHTMRTISFYNIMFVEHILPKWTPEFNAGYGDPHFLFAYFLPYFIGSVLHFIGFSFLISIKLLLALSFIFSGVTMYFWAKDELGEKAGFVTAVFYLYMPYHLVDLNFRVTIAEILSFVFLPLLFLFTKKIIYKPAFNTVLQLSISYGLLIITHQIISLIFSPILVLYALFIWLSSKKIEYNKILSFLLSLSLGFLLSAFYWIPIIFEAKYTQASLSDNISSFAPLSELLYSPWRFGFLFQGHKGELSFIIGYTQIFMVIISVYLLIKNQFDKKTKKLLLFFLVLLIILIFLILPISKDVWKTIPLLKYAQYSYRLSEFVGLCTSIIAGIVITRWNKNIFIIILCFLTIIYTILNWGNRKTVTYITDTYLQKSFIKTPDVGMYLEPSSPIWIDLKKSKIRTKPTNRIEVLSGKAEIKEIALTSISHKYHINSITPVLIKENTLFFPGWTLIINGKIYNINYKNPLYPGIITFSLPRGEYNVELFFRDTFDRTISFVVSSITAIILFLVFLANKFNKWKLMTIFQQ